MSFSKLSNNVKYLFGKGQKKMDSLAWAKLVQHLHLTLQHFLCIQPPTSGLLNPPFHTFAEFRPIVNRIVVRHATDWLAANAKFSPNDRTLHPRV